MLALKVILVIVGLAFALFGYFIFFKNKYYLINGFESDLRSGRKSEAYAKRVGLVEFILGIVILTVAVILIALGGLNSRVQKINTDLEFWIAENVDDVDFSSYRERYGLMGGREYYGRGYIPEVDENGEQRDPEECVIYTVTAYPDYLSNKQHVTRIRITDPSVRIYGLTLESAPGEISDIMEDNGFKRDKNARGLTYKKGNVSIGFSSDNIWISVKVSNILGIKF